MLILIIGAKGKLAYDFKKIFKRLDITYHVLDKDIIDVTNRVLLEKYFEDKNYDIIINCAAYNDVDKAETDIEMCMNLNMSVPENLSVIAKRLNAVFVTFSTDFIFDGEKDSPYSEKDIPNPLSVYGESKYLGEKAVLNNYDKIFVIRTSWLFGMINQDFVKQVINWSKNVNELSIVTDQISAPTYSVDLAEYSWKLIESRKYGLYHITNNGECSKYEQARYVLEKISWKGKLNKIKTKNFNLPAKRAKYSKLSSKKLESTLGEKLPDWRNGIDRFLNELKGKGEL